MYLFVLPLPPSFFMRSNLPQDDGPRQKKISASKLASFDVIFTFKNQQKSILFASMLRRNLLVSTRF